MAVYKILGKNVDKYLHGICDAAITYTPTKFRSGMQGSNEQLGSH